MNHQTGVYRSKMDDNENVKSSDGKNYCKYCRKSVEKSIAECVSCKNVYHTSCALRVQGLIAIGRENLVKCCVKVKDMTTQISAKSGSETKLVEANAKEVSHLTNLLQAKEQIITELKEKQILLYKNITLLEEKVNNYNHSTKKQNPTTQKGPNIPQNIVTIKENASGALHTDGKNKTYNQVVRIDKGKGEADLNPNLAKLHKEQQRMMNEYINLAQETETICTENQKNAYENSKDDSEEGFIQVKGRTRRYTKRLGTGKTEENGEEKGFSGQDRKAWLFINRVQSHVTEAMVSNYIQKKPNFQDENITVKEITHSKKNNWKCFVVTAPLSRKDELYDTEFWPANVGIKRFNFKIYNKSRPLGNF